MRAYERDGADFETLEHASHVLACRKLLAELPPAHRTELRRLQASLAAAAPSPALVGAAVAELTEKKNKPLLGFRLSFLRRGRGRAACAA